MEKSKYYYAGKFGIERETLRVDSQGKLAQTPHPFGSDEHITRDFCENQIELITPVCNEKCNDDSCPIDFGDNNDNQ